MTAKPAKPTLTAWTKNFDFNAILETRAANEATAPHARQEKQDAEKIYTALRPHFREIRHDAALREALTEKLREDGEDLANPTRLEHAAGVLRYRLEQSLILPKVQMGSDLHTLSRLFKTYRQMEREAAGNYNSLPVLLGAPTAWVKNPDCWQQRVKQLRGEQPTEAMNR